jgi:hypothetical protein
MIRSVLWFDVGATRRDIAYEYFPNCFVIIMQIDQPWQLGQFEAWLVVHSISQNYLFNDWDVIRFDTCRNDSFVEMRRLNRHQDSSTRNALIWTHDADSAALVNQEKGVVINQFPALQTLVSTDVVMH